MSDPASAHIATPEGAALKLLETVLASERESGPVTPERYLDLFAECLLTVRNPEARSKKNR